MGAGSSWEVKSIVGGGGVMRWHHSPTSVRNGLEKTRDVETWRPGEREETASLKGEQAGRGPDTDTALCHWRLQLREGLSFQMVHYWRITILKINSPPYERDQIEGNMLLCFLVLFHGKQGSKNALQN